MADILTIYTAEQLYTMYKNKILSDAVGLTDFNAGSKNRAFLESNSELVSIISMDFKEALYKAIPIALYEGFGFTKTAALQATGFVRPYRVPALWIRYTGAGTATALTTDATDIACTVTGAGGDAFTFDYVTYPTTDAVVTAIDNLANWSATLVKPSVASTTLYQYAAEEVIGATNYLAGTGFDIMLSTDIAIAIPTGYSVTLDSLQFISTSDVTILAGTSGIQTPMECVTAGVAGNIVINAIDTVNGKGYISSVIDGIEQAINDTAFSGGDSAETDAERKTRFAETVNALNAGTKTGIIVAIKAISGVRSVGMRTNYPFKGSNTILVDDGTGAISAALLASVEKVLYGDASDLLNFPGKNCEGIAYVIDVPTIIAQNIGLTVYRHPNVNVDLTEISTDVQSAVEQYINTRQLGEDVILSEIVRVGKNANAAVYDIVVTSPGANVSIDENEFSKTGSGTGASVTVTMVIATTI